MTDIALAEIAPGQRAAPATRLQGRHLLGWALIAPSGVFLVLFTYWPAAKVVWQSLHDEQRGRTTFVGLRNFVSIFADATFQHALFNNAVYAVGTVAPSLVLALLFALALERSR